MKTSKWILSSILVVLVAVSIAFAALTKSTAAVDEWAAVAQNAIREGATTDISGCYAATLEVGIALTTDSTAHTGTQIIVQLSGNTSGDEDWFFLTGFISITGTPQVHVLGGSEASGQTVLEITSTTDYEADGVVTIFCLDDTVADSELLQMVSHVSDTSVTVQDGTTQAHDTSDSLSNLAATYTVELPFSANRVRIIYDNTYDVDGSAVHTYARITKVTAL